MVAQPRVDARNEPLAVPKRRWWTRLSSAHILIFSAGALAFIANLAVLRPAELPPNVAVTVSDLLPGTIFDPSLHVEYVPMATDTELLSRYVTEGAVDPLAGHVVANRVPAGTALSYDSLVASRATDGRRIMSLPIDRERAAGGTLVVGDVVDVIAVDKEAAWYVASGLEIVALPEARSGSFTGSTGYHIVLAVDAATALELSEAMEQATIQVIRSTGSPAVLDTGSDDAS